MAAKCPHRALFIKGPYLDKLLDKSKVWEIRNTPCKERGPLALTNQGLLKGQADVTDSFRISVEEYSANREKHAIIAGSEADTMVLQYQSIWVWVFQNPVRYENPIPYEPQVGQVNWIRLSENDCAAIRKVGKCASPDMLSEPAQQAIQLLRSMTEEQRRQILGSVSASPVQNVAPVSAGPAASDSLSPAATKERRVGAVPILSPTKLSSPSKGHTLHALWGLATPPKTAQQTLPRLAKLRDRLSTDRDELLIRSLQERQIKAAAADAADQEIKAAKRQRRESSAAGALVDPHLRDHGVVAASQHPCVVKKAGRPNTGHTTGVMAGKKRNAREVGGPTLRRDPSAFEKLHMATEALKYSTNGTVQGISSDDRRRWEQRFFYSFDQAKTWVAKVDAFREYIATHRIGKYSLRPFGSNRPTSYGSSGKGCRIRIDSTPDQPSVQQPLKGVFHSVKQWFNGEREHNNEVRVRHIRQRLLFTMEAERDRQLVLQQHGSEKFNIRVLTACQQKLSFFSITNPPDKQEDWEKDQVFPFIGATARVGQKMSGSDIALDPLKASLTWQSMDRAIWCVWNGAPEDLQVFVKDPADFIKHKEDTVIVVLDQTALWLKLRGEEKVFISLSECLATQERKRLSRRARQVQSQEMQAQYHEELKKWASSNLDHKGQVDAQYSSAGDKYRLTLVNISHVKNWFRPGARPQPGKPKLYLIVSSAKHCRLKDMSRTKPRVWLNRVEYTKADGEKVIFEKGAPTNGLLESWAEVRDTYADDSWQKHFEIMGQPRAWTDELISAWILDELKIEYGQALINLDCLSSQWSPAVCFQAWSNQQMMVPLSPDSTSYLQEPDTHEHFPLKAELRESKAQLHHSVEAEAKIQGKDSELTWGPWHVVQVLKMGLIAFKEKHVGVPLRGLVANQMTVIRPNSDGVLALIDDLGEEWTSEYRRLPPSRGVRGSWALDRITKVKQWLASDTPIAPVPDWSALDTHGPTLIADDIPQQPDDEGNDFVIDFDMAALGLTEHQKKMLLPVDARIKSIQYPAAVKARVKRTAAKRIKRKSKWAAKFRLHFAGKAAESWKARIQRLGLKSVQRDLQPVAKGIKPPTTSLTKSKRKWAPTTSAAALKSARRVPLEGCPWLGKIVRVAHDEARQQDIGRYGKVEQAYEPENRPDPGEGPSPTTCFFLGSRRDQPFDISMRSGIISDMSHSKLFLYVSSSSGSPFIQIPLLQFPSSNPFM